MSKQRLRDTWLIHKHEAGVLALLYVTMTAIWLSFGLLLTHPLKNTAIVHNDQSVSKFKMPDRQIDQMIGKLPVSTALSRNICRTIRTDDQIHSRFFNQNGLYVDVAPEERDDL